jgi:ADP-heptose:LPS heptosyltransferase
VFLLGSKADTGLCDEIISQAGHPGAVNLAGQLSYLDSASLMKQAKMNFTNDSAPMHLASSVNAPVTVIYCSTIPGFGFGPLSEDSAVAETDEALSCRPCGLHGLKACPEKHFRCALTIPVNKLMARL